MQLGWQRSRVCHEKYRTLWVSVTITTAAYGKLVVENALMEIVGIPMKLSGVRGSDISEYWRWQGWDDVVRGIPSSYDDFLHPNEQGELAGYSDILLVRLGFGLPRFASPSQGRVVLCHLVGPCSTRFAVRPSTSDRKTCWT
jgi:hypothetical protein